MSQPPTPGSPVLPVPPTIVKRLSGIVGGAHVITDPDRLLVYESDGLTA